MRAAAARLRGVIQMAPYAVGLQHFEVDRANLNRILEGLQCELDRVVPAVIGFVNPLREKTARGVAIVTNGLAVMAGLLPTGQLFIHDVAFGAGVGVIAEVGQTLGKLKSVGSQT